MSKLKTKLTPKEYRALEGMWLNDFHSVASHHYEYGNTERWYKVITEYQRQQGFELFPTSIREKEERVMQLGRSQEYLAALADVCSFSPQHNEYDQTVVVLTATAEERVEALKRVLK